jgi:hypothetical protein
MAARCAASGWLRWARCSRDGLAHAFPIEDSQQGRCPQAVCTHRPTCGTGPGHRHRPALRARRRGDGHRAAPPPGSATVVDPVRALTGQDPRGVRLPRQTPAGRRLSECAPGLPAAGRSHNSTTHTTRSKGVHDARYPPRLRGQDQLHPPLRSDGHQLWNLGAVPTDMTGGAGRASVAAGRLDPRPGQQEHQGRPRRDRDPCPRRNPPPRRVPRRSPPHQHRPGWSRRRHRSRPVVSRHRGGGLAVSSPNVGCAGNWFT